MITSREIYTLLSHKYEDCGSWPGSTYRIMVSAILVQNTTWTTVDRVLHSIEDQITPEQISHIDRSFLEETIRPCRYCRRKAEAIYQLTQWYASYKYDVNLVMEKDLETLRKELLALWGIGPETADDILVYAFHKPSFIVDAYTRRLLQRLGHHFANDTSIRRFLTRGFTEDADIYARYHGILLRECIDHCRAFPQCRDCPLRSYCPSAERFEREEQLFSTKN